MTTAKGRSLRVPKLRQIRESKFLTQAELARRSGVSEPSIIRLESGKAGARFSTINKLAEGLGVKPEELTG